MNILYNTQPGGTKDHFMWVKVPGTTHYSKAWYMYMYSLGLPSTKLRGCRDRMVV